MSLNISTSYHSHFSHTNQSQVCFHYYLNPLPSYEVSQSFIISNEQVPSNQKINTPLHDENQWSRSKIITQHPYNDINSTQTLPILYDDYKHVKTHRHKLRKHHKHQHVIKKQSLKPSVLTSQRSDTVNENQQSEFLSSIKQYCYILRDQSDIISDEELTDLLTKLTLALKNSYNNDQQQWFNFVEILDALICVRPSILASVSQNKFFSVLQVSFIDILRRWCHLSSLPDLESFMFRSTTKIISIVINNIQNINYLPSWISDFTLLETIANCLIDIAISAKFLDDKNTRQLKIFTYLIQAYTDYQHLNDKNHSNKDMFLLLIDPIVQCLASSHYLTTFTTMSQEEKSMTTIEEFFLLKCPSFLTSYNGSRLEQIIENLLSVMLPQYITLLDKIVPTVHNWNQSTIEAVNQLLQIINHGASQFQINAKLVSKHLSLIDHVLKLLDEPIFYNNLQGSLSNLETNFMNTAISFLVNMISEPAILAQIKESSVTPVFLRLTSCQHESLVLNVYTLLAYTTYEEDIKAMHNPGRLLATIIASLKTTLNRKPEKRTEIEQLLETLKGLVQHDQIKDEIIKQNALPFLLECTNQLTRRALILIFEILWCLTFIEEIARALRADSNFLDKIQTISKDNNNEPLKKAIDGLVWKLIQEPVFLEKVEKQEEEQKAHVNVINTKTKVQLGSDKKGQVRTTKQRSATPTERSYQYDIMISYCHVDKELTYKIQQYLVNQNFKVWIDLNNMYGPAMSAMADAVENTEFVILCMSDSYKQSTYCQAEAEYAFKCKRRLLPLVMRQGYKPDGWLGFMIGSRIYIDFGRYDFDTACEKLMTEINLQRQQAVPAVMIDPSDHEKPAEKISTAIKLVQENKKRSPEIMPKNSAVNKDAVSSTFKARKSTLNFIRKPINEWTELDVLDFLSAHRLNSIIPLCEAMNGRALMELYKMCTNHRLRAYSVLKNELISMHKARLSISIYSRFLSLLEDFIKFHVVLAPSMNNPATILAPIPFVPAPALNMPYDFSIITNASPLDTLEMVNCFGPQLLLLDKLRRQLTNVSQ
ncbi:unnamed protein product [Rotaria sp. Silwood1]|nr:unnamed protein product [Rotaria sp. Silwood1]CAF0843476.1 unnamed protein product [Rotaria sp. Silwood1]CAF3342076.1 unnamed protein product [Rotaria sp. Silwood1]